MDRAIRSLFHKDVFELEDEVYYKLQTYNWNYNSCNYEIHIVQYNGQFPSVFKTMENGNYTVKLEVANFNIQDTDEMYVANDLYEGFNFFEAVKADENVQQATEFSTGEVIRATLYICHLFMIYIL